MPTPIADRLESIARRTARHRATHTVRFALQSPSRDLDWSWSAPGAPVPYFAASVTKLVTTAIIMQHVDDGTLALDTPAHTLLPAGTLDGLVVHEGRDVASSVTVEHLLAHSSGIADYFEAPAADGTVLVDRLLTEDVSWSPLDALEMVRGVAPACAPGATSRAHYSDTNFQILQLIIEELDHAPYAEVARRRVLIPSGMTASFVFGPEDAGRYDAIAPIHHGAEHLIIPRAMASFQADGGLVSTTADQLALLRAFLSGALFSAALVEHATSGWRRWQLPLEYGVGVMRFRLPRAMNPWRPLPPMVGHSGASGAVLFAAPDLDLYVAGSVNQLENRSLAYRALSELVRAAR